MTMESVETFAEPVVITAFLVFFLMWGGPVGGVAYVSGLLLSRVL